jgi:hypothetical protein
VNEWLSDITLVNKTWLTGFFCLWLILSLLHWFSYRKTVGLRARLLGTVLRSLGLAILLGCLLEPLRSVRVPKPQANSVVVLLDNSRSMRALYSGLESEGVGGKADAIVVTNESLVDGFREVIEESSEWLAPIEEVFRVRRYLFGQQVKGVDRLASWSGSDVHSQLYSSLVNVQSKLAGEAPSAIVLFTDGQTVQSPVFGAVPIYPVLIPSESSGKRDLWIEHIGVQSSEFETAPISLQVRLGHQGLKSESVEVGLLDLEGKELELQNVTLGDAEGGGVVRFQTRPKEVGPQAYRVRARILRDVAGYERTLDNNQRLVTVDRGMGPYRVLYLSGRPNWEFKFLRRALNEDPEMLLTGLVRIAKKQPKFNFRGKNGDDTNPLFSGFEDVPEETKEKIDEPVFARLGVQSKDELTNGFPKDAEELFAYSVVIIDDLELEFFTTAQLQLLRQYVTQRGGSLLVLGGQESLRGRNFKDSILGQMLPVYGDTAEPEMIEPRVEQEFVEGVRYGLTREGWLQPFLRLKDNEAEERRRLESMPGFYVWNRVGGVKAGARVLAEGTQGDGRSVPLLAVQKFGKGTTGALMVGDMWRWALMSSEESASPVAQAWRQLVRGLMVDVPKRVVLETEYDQSIPNLRRIYVRVKDRSYLAMDNANVRLTITLPEGQVIQSVAFPSQETAGLYESSVLLKESGVVRVDALVEAVDGEPVGQGASWFVHEPEIEELKKCKVDTEALERIAKESGGEVLPLRELGGLVERIEPRNLRYTEERIEPLWHSPWWLFSALVCLAFEWWWRRRHGMA